MGHSGQFHWSIMKHPEALRQGAPLFLLKDSKQCISLLAPLRHAPVCSLLYKWAALKSSLQCRCQDFSCAFCKCCANFRIVRVCSTRPRLRQENICCKLNGGFCRPAWEAISITTIRRGIDNWSNVAHCVQQEIQRSRLWAEGHGISWHHMSVNISDIQLQPGWPSDPCCITLQQRCPCCPFLPVLPSILLLASWMLQWRYRWRQVSVTHLLHRNSKHLSLAWRSLKSLRDSENLMASSSQLWNDMECCSHGSAVASSSSSPFFTFPTLCDFIWFYDMLSNDQRISGRLGTRDVRLPSYIPSLDASEEQLPGPPISAPGSTSPHCSCSYCFCSPCPSMYFCHGFCLHKSVAGLLMKW